MTKRDESLPRVSDILKFLYSEEFENIPRDVLEAARDRGIRGHKLIELNWNTNLDHPIVNMFREGLEKIRRFIGNRKVTVVIDYKFTFDKLRPETAMQLMLYGDLINNEESYVSSGIIIENQINGKTYTGKPDFVMYQTPAPFEYFAFHYHQDGGLFIYRIPDRAKERLLDFSLSLVNHHEAIEAGKLIKYDKLIEWDRLQLEYDVFELFHPILPPRSIETVEDSHFAVAKYHEATKIEAQIKHLKNEIKRYMLEENEPYIINPYTGTGVRLEKHKLVVYDEFKKKKEDTKYKAALKKCQIDTGQKLVLKRVKKKIKQIN
jgi:hypothetical protein